MRNKKEKLVACPISKSSNHDEFNDICKATGQQCPYFVDEGMSVCKSKAKCLAYFAKNWSIVNRDQVAKLIASDTKSYAGRRRKYTNTIKSDKHMHVEENHEVYEDNNSFMEDLEAALKNHEEANTEMSSHLDGLEDALKNHEEVSIEEVREETVAEIKMSAIEMYKRNHTEENE